MPRLLRNLRTVMLLVLSATASTAQDVSRADFHARLAYQKVATHRAAPPAVLWLKPLQQTPETAFSASQRYTLAQKNRTFKPHLLVIPVGGVVQFPNQDPFYHNVFSLFDGKRFDLGLYEAGSTKSVTFSREGVSYIFCNIHPEMSAVILALSTRLFAIADPTGAFFIQDIPAGDYEMHLWIEGAPQPALNAITRRVHIASGAVDLGKLEIPPSLLHAAPHTNMYGQPYDRETKPTY